MNIAFLGIGAAFFPALGNTCACIRENDHLYLLDCGSTAFAQLIKLNVLEGIDKVTCIITHRHADHTGSLATLMSYATYVGHFDVTLVHPDGTLMHMLDLAGIERAEYRFAQTDHYQDGRMDVRFHPVRHASTIPAWGVTLMMDGETIYYSGDGEMPPQEVWNDFCAGKIQRLYQDAGRTPHGGHGNFEAFKAACPAHLRSRLFPIHLDCDYREEILREGFGMAALVEKIS